MSLLLDEHRLYLSDEPRVRALRQAVAATVRPGDCVLDLGCGTGVLGLMACEAGARRVYAVDDSGMIVIARALARAAGVADRITHIAGHSLTVDLPERCDVLVYDQIGRLGFEAGLLEFALDARRRLLTPAPRIMPGPVSLHLALAESPRIRGQIDFWDGRPAGIDTSPARVTAANTGYPVDPEHVSPCSAGERIVVLDAARWEGEPLTGTATLTVSRDARIDGLAGWFVAELSPGVRMTNAPDTADRINRRLAFLPFDQPIAVRAGDTIVVTIRLLAGEHILSWEVARPDGGDRRAQSTWHGMLPVREALQRTRDSAVPTLTPRGRARQTVLELCDGVRTVRQIEQALAERHADLFDTPRAAAVFAAEVLAVYART